MVEFNDTLYHKWRDRKFEEKFPEIMEAIQNSLDQHLDQVVLQTTVGIWAVVFLVAALCITGTIFFVKKIME